MTIGMWIRTEACQILGNDSRSSLHWKKNLHKNICGPGRDWQNIQATTRPDHVWPEVWTKIGKTAQNWRRARMEKRGAKTRQCSTTERNLLLLILMTKITKKLSKMRGEKWKDRWQPCRAKEKLGAGNTKAAEEIASQKVPKNYFWLKSGISWIHKATSGIFSTRKTRRLDDPLQSGSQVYSYASSSENSGCKKLQWTRNGKSSRQSQHGNCRKSRARRRSFSKHNETKI